MGSIWEGFGTVWAVFWALLDAFGPFFLVFYSDCFSSIGRRWGPRGLLDQLWVDFGRFWEGFGKILEGFGSILDHFGWFWEGLANFVQVRLCQDPRAVSRSPAERLNARGSSPQRD